MAGIAPKESTPTRETSRLRTWTDASGKYKIERPLGGRQSSRQTDVELIQGSWKQLYTRVRQENDITFKDNRFEKNEIWYWPSYGTIAGNSFGTFELDPTSSPKRVTLKTFRQTMKGLYRLSKDSLTIYYGVDDQFSRGISDGLASTASLRKSGLTKQAAGEVSKPDVRAINQLLGAIS